MSNNKNETKSSDIIGNKTQSETQFRRKCLIIKTKQNHLISLETKHKVKHNLDENV